MNVELSKLQLASLLGTVLSEIGEEQLIEIVGEEKVEKLSKEYEEISMNVTLNQAKESNIELINKLVDTLLDDDELPKQEG